MNWRQGTMQRQPFTKFTLHNKVLFITLLRNESENDSPGPY
jgi:hypothetical protein